MFYRTFSFDSDSRVNMKGRNLLHCYVDEFLVIVESPRCRKLFKTEKKGGI